jgi:hypothetical protein
MKKNPPLKILERQLACHDDVAGHQPAIDRNGDTGDGACGVRCTKGDDPGHFDRFDDAAEWIPAFEVLVFGLGGSSTALVQETQNRLFRYGVVVSAHSDPYVMKMTASTLKPNDVVIAISGTGRTREVVEAVALAKHYRAKAIGITAPDIDLCCGGRCRAHRRHTGVFPIR